MALYHTNLTKETLIPLTSFRRHGGPQKSSMYRYAHGITSKETGELVKLETMYRGGTLCSSMSAYDRFLLRLNGLPTDED